MAWYSFRTEPMKRGRGVDELFHRRRLKLEIALIKAASELMRATGADALALSIDGSGKSWVAAGPVDAIVQLTRSELPRELTVSAECHAALVCRHPGSPDERAPK